MVLSKTQKEVYREISSFQKISSGLFSLRIFFSGYKKLFVIIIPLFVFAIEIWGNIKSDLNNTIFSFIFTKIVLLFLFLFLLVLFLGFSLSDKKYIKYLEYKLERCKHRQIVITKSKQYEKVRKEALEQLNKRISHYEKILLEFEYAQDNSLNVLGI